jgi:hypothetical protein
MNVGEEEGQQDEAEEEAREEEYLFCFFSFLVSY